MIVMGCWPKMILFLTYIVSQTSILDEPQIPFSICNLKEFTFVVSMVRYWDVSLEGVFAVRLFTYVQGNSPLFSSNGQFYISTISAIFVASLIGNITCVQLWQKIPSKLCWQHSTLYWMTNKTWCFFYLQFNTRRRKSISYETVCL